MTDRSAFPTRTTSSTSNKQPPIPGNNNNNNSNNNSKNRFPNGKTGTAPLPQTPPTIIPTNQVNSSEKIGKYNGGILRYPYESLTDKTDYLQIDIRNYNSASSVRKSKGDLVSGRNENNSSRRGNDPFNPNVKNITTKNLSTSPLVPEVRDNKKVSVGTILLPMPSNIQSSNSVDFSNSNLDGLTADVYGRIEDFSTNSTSLSGKTPIEFLEALTTQAGTTASGFITDNKIFGQLLTQQFYTAAANIPLGGSLTRDAIFARSKGEILNQNVELLFNGAKIRSFKFSFKMTPRNNKEAEQIKLIINAFKRHMVPKLTGQTEQTSVNNLFLKSPSIFELTYKSGSIKNPFLNSFKQCFLTDMSVNYTGEGTYAVYNDSTPVSMVLELGFKELEPIYNQDYATANY